MSSCTIIGAGLAGLSTAYHLKAGEYTIYESESRIGGLCRTERIDGFTFDYTGHFLHFRNERVKKLVFDLTGDLLTAHTRKSGIYLYDVITPYPFQINTYGHSAELIKECLLGLIEAKYRHSDMPVRTFEDWINRSCGAGVAKHFMVPYNSKIWTVHPREMTTDWMGPYVPAPDIAAALDGALRPPSGTIGYNAQFYYPKEGGIESLPKALAAHVPDVRLSSRLDWVDFKHRRLSVNGQEQPYRTLVSTMPLKKLLASARGLDPEIAVLANMLRNTSVYTVNIGVDREHLSDYHWLYFPEEKYCFYRVGFPSQLSPSMAPSGMGSLNVEISYTPEKPVDESTILERVIRDLKTAKILNNNDRIVTSQVMRIPCAYVIYDASRREILGKIKDYLARHNVVSIGRYGNWEYSAMEDAILQGMETADRINASMLAADGTTG